MAEFVQNCDVCLPKKFIAKIFLRRNSLKMYQRLRHNPLTMFDIKLPGGINAVATANGSSFTHPTWPRAAALHCRGVPCEGEPPNRRAHQVRLLDFGLIDCTRPSIKQSGRFQAMLCAPMQPTSSGIVLVLILWRLLPLDPPIHSILTRNNAIRPPTSRRINTRHTEAPQTTDYRPQIPPGTPDKSLPWLQHQMR